MMKSTISFVLAAVVMAPLGVAVAADDIDEITMQVVEDESAKGIKQQIALPVRERERLRERVNQSENEDAPRTQQQEMNQEMQQQMNMEMQQERLHNAAPARDTANGAHGR